ncbi:ATP-binding protein [Streptosporangium sp. CA-115845]|uniref:ATP-binding protein n=1 Tax=Streptosporangium sp. CA-115845 TaxID=3240071 RepID=UPI003D943514
MRRTANLVKWCFSAVPESVPQARVLVATVLSDWGIAGECVDDAGLCVTELAANALKHGNFCECGFVVTIAVGDGCAHIAVYDHSIRRPRLRHPDSTDPSGRGLMIVNELADAWGVDEHDDGKAVWARFKFPAAIGTGRGGDRP